MRKIFEIQQENIIECDNKHCDYVVVNTTKDPNVSLDKYVNMPCPKCGDNLLTEKDYLDSKNFLKVLNWINKWFSWLTIFMPSNSKESSVKVHNGIKVEDKLWKQRN